MLHNFCNATRSIKTVYMKICGITIIKYRFSAFEDLLIFNI